MEKESRSRTPLTAEQLEDARRLKAAFERVKAERRVQHDTRVTQESLAAACGWNTQSAAWQYLNGHIPLNLDALTKISAYLGVHPAEISPRLAAQIAPITGGLNVSLGNVGLSASGTVGGVPPALSPRQRALLALFDGLTESQQGDLLRSAEATKQKNDALIEELVNRRKKAD